MCKYTPRVYYKEKEQRLNELKTQLLKRNYPHGYNKGIEKAKKKQE